MTRLFKRQPRVTGRNVFLEGRIVTSKERAKQQLQKLTVEERKQAALKVRRFRNKTGTVTATPPQTAT